MLNVLYLAYGIDKITPWTNTSFKVHVFCIMLPLFSPLN